MNEVRDRFETLDAWADAAGYQARPWHIGQRSGSGIEDSENVGLPQLIAWESQCGPTASRVYRSIQYGELP